MAMDRRTFLQLSLCTGAYTSALTAAILPVVPFEQVLAPARYDFRSLPELSLLSPDQLREGIHEVLPLCVVAFQNQQCFLEQTAALRIVAAMNVKAWTILDSLIESGSLEERLAGIRLLWGVTKDPKYLAKLLQCSPEASRLPLLRYVLEREAEERPDETLRLAIRNSIVHILSKERPLEEERSALIQFVLSPSFSSFVVDPGLLLSIASSRIETKRVFQNGIRGLGDDTKDALRSILSESDDGRIRRFLISCFQASELEEDRSVLWEEYQITVNTPEEEHFLPLLLGAQQPAIADESEWMAALSRAIHGVSPSDTEEFLDLRGIQSTGERVNRYMSLSSLTDSLSLRASLLRRAASEIRYLDSLEDDWPAQILPLVSGDPNCGSIAGFFERHRPRLLEPPVWNLLYSLCVKKFLSGEWREQQYEQHARILLTALVDSLSACPQALSDPAKHQDLLHNAFEIYGVVDSSDPADKIGLDPSWASSDNRGVLLLAVLGGLRYQDEPFLSEALRNLFRLCPEGFQGAWPEKLANDFRFAACESGNTKIAEKHGQYRRFLTQR
jgi:hypothetical protein